MRPNENKPRFIFVGGFAAEAPDGSIGGQLFACRSLVQSRISDHVNWVLIDSTTASVPTPPLRRRIGPAALRLGRFIREVARAESAGALVFTSSGMSFIEKGAMVIAARTLRKRVVLCPRSGLILDDLDSSDWMRRYITYVMTCADVVMCQSAGLRDLLVATTRLPLDHFPVVHNWIDVRSISFFGREDRDGETVFLFLGRLETYKGILDLVEAVGLASESLRHARFIVCGAGAAQSAAESRVDELGLADRFDFRGWVKEEAKTAAFDESDVLVMPSHREGLPNALLEGMAAGLAIIGSRVGGIPDVIEDEVTGLLIESNSPSLLSAALVRLHKSGELRRTLALAARASVMAKHDTDAVWPRVLELLDP